MIEDVFDEAYSTYLTTVQFVVSDLSIWQADREAIPQAKHIMCFFHLKQRLKGELCSVEWRDRAEEYLADVDRMHWSTTEDE